MDRITQSFLVEFVDGQQLAGLPENSQFEHFAAYVAVRSDYEGASFDTSDIVVGAGGDTGIDAIAILVNGALVTDIDDLEEVAQAGGYLDVVFIFIQAERSSSFDASKIGDFGFGVKDFFDDQPRLVRNAKIKAAAEIMAALYKLGTKFRPGNPECRLYYVTTGIWVGDANLEARKIAVENDIRSLQIFRDVKFECLGASRLQHLYRLTKNAITREFTFANRTLVPEIPGVSEAYVGFVPMNEFLSIISDENGELVKSIFYANVRDWQDYNPVNIEIKDTLSSGDKARFVLMNNGITIIARSLRSVRRDRFLIEDFQIVNGCQTSHVLYDQRMTADDSVLIPLRLIATEDENVINAIIRATNRQTKVEEEQFFALTDFAQALEDFFKTFPDGRKLYYERRSRQYDRTSSVQTARIITHANLVRAVASMFLSAPHQTTRSYKAIREMIGKDIFVDGHKLEPYYVAACCLFKLESMFKSSRIDTKLKAARFHVLLAVMKLLHSGQIPRMNSNDMVRVCNAIIDIVWSTKADDLFQRAAQIVELAADGNFHRDNIRTLPFTEKVIAACAKGTNNA